MEEICIMEESMQLDGKISVHERESGNDYAILEKRQSNLRHHYRHHFDVDYMVFEADGESNMGV